MKKSLQDIITEVRDTRTAEAAKKGYLGPQGKIASIAMYLGNPITEHTYEMPMFVEEVVPGVITPSEHYLDDIGYFFSTTSHRRGLEIEVNGEEEDGTYNIDDITVMWNCDIVYREEFNRLMAYVPGAWESTIEHLWKRVEARKDDESSQINASERKEAEKLHKSFVNWLKSAWGV